MNRHAWPELINALIAKENLSESETAWAMAQIMSGEATGSQIAGFVVALRAKGETAAEVAGFVDAMLAVATPSASGRPARGA